MHMRSCRSTLVKLIFFMKKDIFIGEYTVIKTLRSATNDTVTFEVIKSNSPQQKYIAEVYPLHIHINLRKILSVVKREVDNGIAEEVICLTKYEREYLIIIRNNSRKVAKEPRFDRPKIDPADCIRLIMEAIELVEGLHMMGVYLECPIGYFTQVEDNSISTMSLLKIKNPVSYSNI
jgi:hypothetical protein